MWGRSVVMMLVLLAFVATGVEWLFGRHAIVPLDAQARTAAARPEAPPPLIAAEPPIVAHEPQPGEVRRIASGLHRTVAATLTDPEIERAIADLHDDDIPRNAERAIRKLAGEPTAEPALRAALRSTDLQQRQMAALILRRQDAEPDPQLIEVSLEAFEPETNRLMARVIPGSIRRSVLPYLYRHPRSCIPQARAMLWKDARGDRLVGAFLLACAQDTQHLGSVVQILCSHLQDNKVGGDALLATHGLYKLGEAGRSMVDGMRRHADAQAHALLSLVLEDLRQPPTTLQEFHARSATHDASNIYHDPAVEYVVGRMSVMGY